VDHREAVTGRPLNAAQEPRSRSAILRNAFVGALAVGGAFGTGALLGRAGRADAAVGPKDAKILNFLLELEQLQTTFFDRIGRDARFGAEVRQFASVTAKQDRAHATALRAMLGSAAKPTTADLKADPHTDAEFIRDALELKEAAVAAYLGEGPNLRLDKIQDVASIVSVEARHAAWIRSIDAVIPAPRAADRSQAPHDVVRTLERAGIATVR
jgi:Ferritin-like domain